VREGLIHRPLSLAVLSVTFVLVLSSPGLAQEDNCGGFPNQAAAQHAPEDDSSDPTGLDGPPGAAFAGIRGVACEDLPPPINLDPVDPGPGQEPPDDALDPGPRQELLEAGGD